MTKLEEKELEAIVNSEHGAPHNFLGMHALPGGAGLIVRTFQPFAQAVEVVNPVTGDAVSLERIHSEGFFQGAVPGEQPFAYQFNITDGEGQAVTSEDPYRFPLQITDFDAYLIGEGTHYRTYEKMGAHLMTLEGVSGVHFAVWAPNAARLSLVGNFNRWDGRHHPMTRREGSGLWEIFMPGMKQGDIYKFEVKGTNEYLSEKADPYAFAAELRPRSGSVVWDVHAYEWNDQAWMEQRRATNTQEQPISVYEVHLGSWRRVSDDENGFLTYRELAEQLIPYVKDLGFTHIELLPISEHPFDGSWGYQTIGYYAITSRFGTPDDFKFFVDRCHQEGLGVIIDWVPAHFPKDQHGLAYFDGTHLYEHADPRKGEHSDWGTLIFNYGRNEVRTFLLSNAMFMAEVYHIDGIRVDAVASMLYLDYSREDGEWIPNEYGGRENLEAISFLKAFNEIIHADYPGFLTFAEESTAYPMVSQPTYLGGLGFGFKWNMGWMHDTLEYFTKEPIHRKFHHNDISFPLLYAFSENFILPLSHDEVVHGKASILDKMPGDMWQKFANVRLLYAFMFTHPGKKLLFMGCEIGQWMEWDFASSLDWNLLDYEPHRKLQQYIAELNHLYRNIPAMNELDLSWEGFEWIDIHDSDQSVLSYMRKGRDPDAFVVGVLNLTPVPREGYRVGVPHAGMYQEILNSDSEHFGGSNVGNAGMLPAESVAWQGRDYSLMVTLPPLGALFFQPADA